MHINLLLKCEEIPQERLTALKSVELVQCIDENKNPGIRRYNSNKNLEEVHVGWICVLLIVSFEKLP